MWKQRSRSSQLTVMAAAAPTRGPGARSTGAGGPGGSVRPWERAWGAFWGRVAYHYYNWRQSTASDLQLFVGAFM